jgi:ribonuclease VapC
MILDTSALVAILLAEPGWENLRASMQRAPHCKISAVSYVELAIVAVNRLGEEASGLSDDLLRSYAVLIEPVTPHQAILARQAFYQYGKGRHPAALNFGDCFAYALAKSTGEPLLFRGNDFSQTDLIPALE